MTCKDVRNLLAAGRPLTEEALAHVGSCPGCSAMLSSLDNAESASLDERAFKRFESQLTGTLKPVRPLPSDSMLTGIAFALFAVCTLAGCAMFSVAGFRALNVEQRIVYYGAILVIAVLLSFASIRQIIPGSRRIPAPSALVSGTIVLISVMAILLFQTFTMARFVRRGIPCLRLGLICAAVCGALNIFVARAGYSTTPVGAGLLLGSLAGLTGFAVLSVHCPILVVSHIMVWHLGAVVIAAIIGMMIGYIWREKSS